MRVGELDPWVISVRIDVTGVEFSKGTSGVLVRNGGVVSPVPRKPKRSNHSLCGVGGVIPPVWNNELLFPDL
ncbi:hypothetical protein PVL30_003983 [Lodderomyces elongisporus]|uniref:uncharacterized protein n=1 Tax=Lodderomyces elongisporus TaxID=36914 RepID=UPI00291E057E|nr:uncharacterized protein PVL30_003983 [Lodderomyces elongisporus]WLF80207.1 hypothetical protein PVL30_003983 [Lodderomyces elongisporus]